MPLTTEDGWSRPASNGQAWRPARNGFLTLPLSTMLGPLWNGALALAEIPTSASDLRSPPHQFSWRCLCYRNVIVGPSARFLLSTTPLLADLMRCIFKQPS